MKHALCAAAALAALAAASAATQESRTVRYDEAMVWTGGGFEPGRVSVRDGVIVDPTRDIAAIDEIRLRVKSGAVLEAADYAAPDDAEATAD